ncbi:hypothetical protein ID866_9653 [Astraeus odoratus]|nr:hypothetical protein ID866_9653 [Astraeus odoratus]
MRDWERSPTPEETWSDASGGNEHGEWPIEGIVGEEICLDGTSKYEVCAVLCPCIHSINDDQVRWGNWSRADGSNTTWQTDIPDRPELVNRWKRKQRRKRVALAEDNLDMDVRWPEDTIHQRLTCQRAQGYEEKKQRRIPAPSTANWDQEVEVAYRRLDERSVEDSVPHLRVRRNASISSIASQRRGRTTSPALSTASRDILQAQSSPPITTPSRGRPRLDTLSSTSSRYGTQTRASSSTATPLRQASQTLSSAGQSDISWGSGRDVTDPPFSQTLCSRIASAWTRAARDVMAAAVRIDSNILDEAMPLSLRRFRYIEKGYVLSRRWSRRHI